MMRKDRASIKQSSCQNIWRERKLRNGHACIQNMVGVRNIWREKKKKSIWMHTYMQKYHMG